MSVKDIRSSLQALLANLAVVSGNGTTNGAIIDTADFELGLMFTMAIVGFTDGVYNIVIEESDADDMAGAENVTGDKLIGALADMELDAESANGDVLPSIGVISNKRYVRVNVVATGVTTGATAIVTAIQKGEVMPV